jgi:hypothetical protein
MPEPADISQSIRQLASADSHVRERAAREIHAAGSDLCSALIDRWRQDSDFRPLLIFHSPTGSEAGTAGLRVVVGVAVRPEGFEKIRAANEAPRLANVPPDQDAMEFELHFGHHAELDILTTKAPEQQGAIARFLNKFGEGIQQVEIYVSDVDRATEVVKKKFQLDPIYPATRAGADGTRVNFFLATTPQNKKLLLELVEDKTAQA